MDNDFNIALTSKNKSAAQNALSRLVETNTLTEPDARILRTDAKTRGVRKKASIFLREPTVEMERLLNVLGAIIALAVVCAITYFGWGKLERKFSTTKSTGVDTVTVTPNVTETRQSNTPADKEIKQEENPQYQFSCTVLEHGVFDTRTATVGDKSFTCKGAGYIDLTANDRPKVSMKIQLPGTSKCIELHDGNILATEQNEEPLEFKVGGTWSMLSRNGEAVVSGEYEMRVTNEKAEVTLQRTTLSGKRDMYTITIHNN